MKISIIKFLQKKLKTALISTISFWMVLIGWMILADNFNPLILPSPVQVIDALITLFKSGELQHHFFISIQRTFIGYSSAVIFGCGLALLLAKSWILRKVFRPLITVIQSTPPIIWLVLAVIWFGISDDLTPIFLIFIVSLPIIFINIYEVNKFFVCLLFFFIKIFYSFNCVYLIYIFIISDSNYSWKS